MIYPQNFEQKKFRNYPVRIYTKGRRTMTKTVQIGNRIIGGGNPILIQSMTNTKTENVEATAAQINQLTAAGCDIIRCAVPTMDAAKALKEIKKQVQIPVVADIHFDYRLAIAAMENGADKIRINPGNIGSAERVKAVVDVAKERNIPIRVGVNSGSLEKNLVEKYHGVTAEGLVESALDKVKLIEDMGYDNLVISIKSSDVMMCVKAHELIASQTDHPLHVGITEAGTIISGNIKSAIGPPTISCSCSMPFLQSITKSSHSSVILSNFKIFKFLSSTYEYTLTICCFPLVAAHLFACFSILVQ